MNGSAGTVSRQEPDFDSLNLQLKQSKKYASFHGDALIGDVRRPTGFLANWRNSDDDFRRILFNPKNYPALAHIISKFLTTQTLDIKRGAGLIAALSNDSNRRAAFVESQVKSKYERMLHPPLTYLGDAFQYRAVDGKFNSAMSPHLGQAGAPYAKTVPSKTHPLGALPDAGNLFDRLMAREEGGRQSKSGLSSMLIYHATIIIHDIFRTNDNDKNISDSSSYLDLSPLYGFTMEVQRQVRDDKFKLGLLKPDTFAEDRLLRQPPGVCIMLVMYNRYHNYAATQIRRINENGRFSVPKKYRGLKLIEVARHFLKRDDQKTEGFKVARKNYHDTWKKWMADSSKSRLEKARRDLRRAVDNSIFPDRPKQSEFETEYNDAEKNDPDHPNYKKEPDPAELDDSDLKILVVAKKYISTRADNNDFKSLCAKYTEARKRYAKDGVGLEVAYEEAKVALQSFIDKAHISSDAQQKFEHAYDAAWNKLDDDLFNTARLITCGQYIQVSIHDYLRALMGFHQWNTDFTLEPRTAMNDHRNVSRGLGNQVTVEFNLLYRFHCAIPLADEDYTEKFMIEAANDAGITPFEPKNVSLPLFLQMTKGPPRNDKTSVKPSEQEFGLKKDVKKDLNLSFKRNEITGLFDDQQMANQLRACMDEPISNFGPRNVPRCLRSVEIMGILQARQWQIGTLNDFRDFFGMSRHDTFESITGDAEVANALRDLYEHPDKVELYPGIFCESDRKQDNDPGPSDVDAALWAAIFSDAITLVRSDRFYTVDWNTNSLTSWGMKEVTSYDNELKSSVFHRLLQRAFPGWFPYNSIRFFHPFYTGAKNAEFAQQQGYGSDFRMTITPEDKDMYGKFTKYKYEVKNSDPVKPWKPCYLDKYDEILAVLSDKSDNLVHPARTELAGLPQKVVDILSPQNPSQPKGTEIIPDDNTLRTYFADLMHDIIKRESILMDTRKVVYQIDITRDFAIPVTTRYVADFLGFGHLIKGDQNPKAAYSENQIYQHITNCQIFFSYNADETKLLNRRKAYRSSMTFLYDLTRNGNISQANRWSFTRDLISMGKRESNPMVELGLKVAERVLEHQKGDVGRSAAILLMTALDSAYNSVLAFTSVLNYYIKGLYRLADLADEEVKSSEWLEVQRLAIANDADSEKELTKKVLEAQRVSVRLPILRRAIKDTDVKDTDVKNTESKVLFTVKKGQTVICDINSIKQKDPADIKERKYLTYQPGFISKYVNYDAEHVAIVGLESMIKAVAQMKNLRRGKDTQGYLKKIDLDSSSEGYSNFMAPLRMKMVEADAKYAREHSNAKGVDDIFNTRILRPSTDTYLTPEWDEFVPFPTTWKVCFDGFGPSDYGGVKYPILQESIAGLPDDFPPFYQPQGVSKFGGSFADTTCVCNGPGVILATTMKN
ncbi:hypothetical protein P7C71_g2427, partial [Lecanoromycetidae sp. Uapishka_2]